VRGLADNSPPDSGGEGVVASHAWSLFTARGSAALLCGTAQPSRRPPEKCCAARLCLAAEQDVLFRRIAKRGDSHCPGERTKPCRGEPHGIPASRLRKNRLRGNDWKWIPAYAGMTVSGFPLPACAGTSPAGMTTIEVFVLTMIKREA
jgi:hypothetical protein